MKKALILTLSLILFITGCKKDDNKIAYTPEVINDYSISCIINNDDIENGYKMEEVQTFDYDINKKLKKVVIKIHMDLLNDEAKEKLNSVIENYKSVETIVNNNLDNLYDGMSMSINSTEDVFEVSIVYDILKLNLENIDNLEFREYINNEFKFDIDKYKNNLTASNAKCNVNLH